MHARLRGKTVLRGQEAEEGLLRPAEHQCLPGVQPHTKLRQRQRQHVMSRSDFTSAQTGALPVSPSRHWNHRAAVDLLSPTAYGTLEQYCCRQARFVIVLSVYFPR